MNKERSDKLPRGRALTPHNESFREDAQNVYDELRAQAPQFEDSEFGRTLLTSFDDVRTVIRDKRFSVNAAFSNSDSYMRRIAATGLDVREGDTAYEPPLVLLDDPDHRRVRSLMSKAFTPRAVENMRHRIEEIANDLLDAISGRHEFDLIEDYAGPLPTQVILDMMGMSDASTSDFKTWSEDILMGYDPDRDHQVRDGLRTAYVAMSREFKNAVADRRRAPSDDLISAMVRAQEQDDKLNDLEIISLCTQLMVAGNVTTSDLIGSGLYNLMNHPDSLKRLSENSDLIENAVEEMLRFDCPIAETGRIATEDLNLNGCPVSSGQTMTASLSAANHDPTKFSDPHSFDIERENNEHLAFGSGIHVCLGAPLARLEAQIAVSTLLQRYPNISLDDEKKPLRRILPFFSGFTYLPVRIN